MANNNGTINFYLYATANQGNVPSYFDIGITSSSNPYLGVAIVDAWCIDPAVPISYLSNYTGVLYSTNEYQTWDSTLFPTVGNKENLDLVNWLINQDFSSVGNSAGYTYADVQGAIWTLLGDPTSTWDPYETYDLAKVAQLVTLAGAHNGYTPDITDSDLTNDYLALAVDVKTSDGATSQQPIIIKIQSAALGDYVWEDTNADGIQNNSETGIADVTVNLVRDLNNDGDFADNNEILQTTQTGSDGSYKFVGLAPGIDYQVQFVTPSGYDSGTLRQAGGNKTVDSDGAISDVVVLAAGEWNKTIDAGYYKTASLGDRVWVDANANGVQDTGETNKSGVTVELYQSNDLTTVIATQTTGSDGAYLFTGLVPGDYVVKFVSSDGSILSTADVATTDDLNDSDAGTSGFTGTYTLASGDNNLSVDAGFYELASLGDRVWVDANANGVQDTGEANKSGVTVELYRSSDLTTVIATQTTGSDGAYLFTGLVPGDYVVKFLSSDGSILSTADVATTDDLNDSDAGTSGFTGTYTLASGDNNLSVDAGFYELASLGDRVWVDANANGVQDTGEANKSGVTVELYRSSDLTAVIATQTTGSDGAYLFTGLVPGDYVVKFVSSDGSILSTADVATTDDLNDSDAGTSGFTGTYTLASGDNNLSVDAGFYELAGLGDTIWYDKDTDGVQDSTETGVSNLTVNLIGAGDNGVFGDSDDIILATDTTDSNGNYLFTGLNPGDYQVQFSAPAGYVYSQQNQGSDDAQDSDAAVATGRSETVTLASGETDLTVDAGVYKVGIDVEKYVSGNQCTTVNSCGGEGANTSYWKYHYTNSWSGSYWSGTGCKTSDNFNSVFGTNISAGNKSLYQVLCTTGGGQEAFMRECVSAYLNACHDKVDYAYTKEQVCSQAKYALSCGNYTDTYNSFCKENSSGCDWSTVKHTYSCTVDTTLYDADAPPGLELKVGSTAVFTYIVKNTGDSALKDVQLVDDRIATVSYVSGDTNSNGWLDVNETWTYKAQETVAAGTIKNTGTVTATDAVGSVAKVTDQDDAYYTGYTSTTTKASLGDRVWLDKDGDGIQESGEYGISGVKVTLKSAGSDGVFGTSDDTTATTTTNSSGNYIFNNLAAGNYQVLVNGVNGYAFTKQNQGSNDALDSDVDGSGASQIVTLAAGEQNLTIDAGVYCAKASVGNKVWDDMNHNSVQDSSEPGIANIKITLFKGDGTTFVASTTTDSNGNYLFSNLDAGTYVLQFDKTNVQHYNYGAWYNMSNWKWAPKDSGSNDAIDSDVAGDGVSKTNVTKTDAFTLVAGQNDTTKDAGITPIVIDLNGDGVQTVARSASTGSFDLLGNGTQIESGWLSGSDGFLAIDGNGNNQIDSISELFGGLNKGDGFAKLANYDSNNDGVVNSSDTDFANLKIWQDANGNHQTDAGELMSLTDAGIIGLNLSYIEVPAIDAQGNLHLERSNALLADGSSADMTDVYFNVSADDVAAAGLQVSSLADLAADSMWLV